MPNRPTFCNDAHRANQVLGDDLASILGCSTANDAERSEAARQRAQQVLEGLTVTNVAKEALRPGLTAYYLAGTPGEQATALNELVQTALMLRDANRGQPGSTAADARSPRIDTEIDDLERDIRRLQSCVNYQFGCP
jgi:hypothetical protein